MAPTTNNQTTFAGVDKPWPLTGPVVIGDRTYNITGSNRQHLWPVSVALAAVIESRRPSLGVCCDVGCGLGLAGIVASQFAESTWLIDRGEDTCHLARANCEANGVNAIVLPVSWHALHAPFDSIIASEILYQPHDLESLAGFIKRNWTGKAPCLLANATDGAGGKFERLLSVHGMTAKKSLVTCDQFGISYFLWEIAP